MPHVHAELPGFQRPHSLDRRYETHYCIVRRPIVFIHYYTEIARKTCLTSTHIVTIDYVTIT